MASHREARLWGPKIVCSNPPDDSVSLCGATVLSAGVFGVYILASSTLARLVASMRVWGSGMVRMCAANIPPGAWGRQANQGPYTRLPLGV